MWNHLLLKGRRLLQARRESQRVAPTGAMLRKTVAKGNTEFYKSDDKQDKYAA